VDIPANLYEVLGVPEDATAEEIRDAFRRLAAQTHPDVAGNDPATLEKYRAATRAYKVLGDVDTRRAYDRHRVPPNSIQEFFATNPVALHLLNVQLPTASASPQRGVWLTANVSHPAKTAVFQTKLERPGYAEPLTISLQLPETQKPWCRLTNLGGLGRNGADNGELWLFVKD